MTQYRRDFGDFAAAMQTNYAACAPSFSLTLSTAIPTLPRRVAHRQVLR
jgi:hypothetical protein